MKKLIFIFMTLFGIQALADEPAKLKCIKDKGNVHKLQLGLTFEVKDCSRKKIEKDLVTYLLHRSGYEFEWSGFHKSDIKKALFLLATSHRDQLGSSALSNEELGKVSKLYASKNTHETVEEFEFADSYMSGTSASRFAVFYNQDKSEITLVEKYIYAE